MNTYSMHCAKHRAPNYAAGNLLNILLALGPVRGYDFGQLCVWQADLRNAEVQAVNFQQADLTGTRFADTFASIIYVQFTPDGERLLAGCADGTLRLWRVRDGQQRAERGELCVGTMDSWVLWNLTGGAVHACDLTNASRTHLLDIHTLQWSDALLALFGVPRAAVPDVRPLSAYFGASVDLGRLPTGVPVMSLIGDSHAALFGQAGFHPGTVKATYGTGSWLMTPTPAPVVSQHGLSPRLPGCWTASG